MLNNFNKVSYSTVANQVGYRFSFQVNDEKDLRVQVVDPADREQVPLFLTVDYTVDGVGQADGGMVNLTATGQKKASEGLKLTVKKGQAHECPGDEVIIDDFGTNISEDEVAVGIDYSDDNRIIYQKTIACGAIPASDFTYTPHNLTGLRRYWVAWAYAAHSQGHSLPLPLSHQQADLTIYLALSTEYVQLTTWSDYWSTRCPESYVTIRYTKE